MAKLNIVAAIEKIYQSGRNVTAVERVKLLMDATCDIAKEIAEIQNTLSDSDWAELIEWEEK